MENQGFTIKKLFYQNLGEEPFYLRNFYHTVEYLDEPFSEMTRQVVRLLLGDMHACDAYCHEDSRIQARVQMGAEEYTVSVMFEDRIAMFYVTDAQGEDHTLRYLQTIEDIGECRCFEKPGAYPVRLHRNGKPAQKSPQRLLPGKDYWLHLETDGRFTVRKGIDGEEIPCLSETENWVYHYLCFLQKIRLWDESQAADPEYMRFPVVIRDFSGRVDESVDIKPLYAQAETLGRQVLIIE